MADHLHLSRSLSVPASYVTSTGGVLAVRGAGKTNASRLMAEQMFEAGYPFVAVDPVGSWYGLRAGRDGAKRGGLDVFIFGGKHGDVPLTRESGELVADVIVDQRLACVLDLTEFNTEADKKYFLLKFAMRLFKRNTEPLHLFLEEADDYIPQKPMRDELHLKRAWENIVRRGRSRGLGMTIITQRSAVVNKDVLTQVENLFVLRTTGPQDIKAINEWVKYHSVDDSMLESLASLEDGEAWIWSPHLLKEFKRFRFNLSQTFDSGATPKGKKGRPVATLRDVDVGKLKGRIQETIEKAAQENPVLLRAENARLAAALRTSEAMLVKATKGALQKATAAKDLKLKLKLPDMSRVSSDIEKLRQVTATVEKQVMKLHEAVLSNERTVDAAVQRLASEKGRGVDALLPPTLGRAKKDSDHILAKRASEKRGATTLHNAASDVGALKLDKCARSIMNVLSIVAPKAVSTTYLSIMTGYSVKSSSMANALGQLRSQGLAVGPGDAVAITDKGAMLYPATEKLPEGEELLEWWKGKLDKASREILQVFYDAGPNPAGGGVTKEDVAEHSGYSATSSSVANGLGKLRALELINGWKISPIFFKQDA